MATTERMGQRPVKGARKPPRTASGPPPAPPKRRAPRSLRLPPDVEDAVVADAERRGVSVNEYVTEACRRRLHPPTKAARASCSHPEPARVSQPQGKFDCRLCGERGIKAS